MSDPGKYRTAAELEEHKKRDPLVLSRRMLEDGAKDRLAKLEEEIEKEVAEAVKFADESPEPDASVLAPTTYNGTFAS
jgi:pyruvate dehydrogenase E1 component alpha subunit